MQPDVAKAQAATIAEWAEEWDRDAVGGDGAGAVAFALRKAAAAIAVATGDPADEAPEEVTPSVVEPVTETREG